MFFPSASVMKLATVNGVFSYSKRAMISPLEVSIKAYIPSGKSLLTSAFFVLHESSKSEKIL